MVSIMLSATSISFSGPPPFNVQWGEIQSVPGLSQGEPYSANIVYPFESPSNYSRRFPLVSFAHGTGGGYNIPIGYKTDLERPHILEHCRACSHTRTKRHDSGPSDSPG